MFQIALSRQPLNEKVVQLAPGAGYLMTFSIVVLGLAIYLPDPKIGLYLFSCASSLLILSVLIKHLERRYRRAQSDLQGTVAKFVELDSSPSFTTDADGIIGYRNGAARERFGTEQQTLLAALSDLFAAPSATLYRLQNKANFKGHAREDVVVRRGHLRLSVHQIGKTGFLWRLEEIFERNSSASGAEGLSLPMLTVSKAGTVLFMNDALRRLIGGRVSSLDRIFPHHPLESGQIYTICATNGPVEVQICIVESASGRQEIFLSPIAMKQRHATRSWNLLEELPVPLLKVDSSGKTILCNKLARELLEIENVENEYLGELVEGLGRSVADWLTETAETQDAVRSEFVRASRPLREMYLQVSLTRVVENGQTNLVVVLNDATKLKTLEAQFVQSQKMQAIGQLAGGVAHDFNNLLTAISGHCDLLMLRPDESDPDFGDLNQINQNANRAASLVGQLLAFSRKQTLKPEVVEDRDTLDELAHLLNRLVGERVDLSLIHDPNLLPIRADKRQLEQVIMNLVVNARDAMPEGGEVRIKTRMENLDTPFERDRVMISPGRYVVISVSDRGTGIAPDKLPKIFEPFFTTKRTGEGTGLGLSMAYGIVKQTGGYIFADSFVGHGRVFTLYFPAHNREEVADPIVATVAPKPLKPESGGVILLVEDEAPVRAFASRALKMRGYTVLEAENAEDALKTLEDPALKIDVFVTDVIMPGMDEPSWVAKALVDRPDVRVVFVSGYAEDNFSEQQARIPNSVFLPKPFSLSELTATVQEQIR